VSVPQHDRWVELFDEVQRDPLPLWTRFGAATLPDTLFPRDYHTNPVLVYFSRRKRWREWVDPWFLALVGYPLLYPACLLVPTARGGFAAMAVLLWSVVFGLVMLLLHARMTLFAGIVAVHVALTGRGWWDTLRRVSSHVAFLVGGLVTVLVSSAMCTCVGLVVVILFGILLKEKTNDLAEDLWSRPEEWKEEG
jgi:hypothetical protein